MGAIEGQILTGIDRMEQYLEYKRRRIGYLFRMVKKKLLKMY
jgi:hypothetical protein